MNSPAVLQWRVSPGEGWRTVELSGIPVAVPVAIRIDFAPAGALAGTQDLIDEIRSLVVQVRGLVGAETVSDALIKATAGEHVLEVVVSNGTAPFVLDARVEDVLDNDRPVPEDAPFTWVLPIMPASGSPGTLPEALRKQNVAFWNVSIKELALTVLARAGVTSLDRRVFISYRRVDTESLAHQIRIALEARNFRVFLDSVSVDPGINFQASLFEQLADKSMVIMLHSTTFAQSHWTMEEFNYVKDHDLSLCILRMPDVEVDRLVRQYRAGDVIELASGDVKTSAPGTLPMLTDVAFHAVLERVTVRHDLEMISRLASLRQRTLDALAANNVRHSESIHNASIQAEADGGGKTYRLFPASRPPGVSEVYEASVFSREPGDRRFVIGLVSAFNEERRRQMDWTVDGRNVGYVDVSMLDLLAKQLKGGAL